MAVINLLLSSGRTLAVTPGQPIGALAAGETVRKVYRADRSAPALTADEKAWIAEHVVPLMGPM